MITLLAIMLVGGPIWALDPWVFAHGGDPNLIHGCVDDDGEVSIVGPNDTCEEEETPLDWNILVQALEDRVTALEARVDAFHPVCPCWTLEDLQTAFVDPNEFACFEEAGFIGPDSLTTGNVFATLTPGNNGCEACFTGQPGCEVTVVPDISDTERDACISLWQDPNICPDLLK